MEKLKEQILRDTDGTYDRIHRVFIARPELPDIVYLNSDGMTSRQRRKHDKTRTKKGRKP